MRDPVSWRGLADVAHSGVWSRFAWPCDLGATRRRSAEFIRTHVECELSWIPRTRNHQYRPSDLVGHLRSPVSRWNSGK